jgi:hypothetical protein
MAHAGRHGLGSLCPCGRNTLCLPTCQMMMDFGSDPLVGSSVNRAIPRRGSVQPERSAPNPTPSGRPPCARRPEPGSRRRACAQCRCCMISVQPFPWRDLLVAMWSPRVLRSATGQSSWRRATGACANAAMPPLWTAFKRVSTRSPIHSGVSSRTSRASSCPPKWHTIHGCLCQCGNAPPVNGFQASLNSQPNPFRCQLTNLQSVVLPSKVAYDTSAISFFGFFWHRPN